MVMASRHHAVRQWKATAVGTGDIQKVDPTKEKMLLPGEEEGHHSRLGRRTSRPERARIESPSP